MAEHSTIEWTDATWNPITGCSIKSPGCNNCYAMQLAGTRLKHHPSRQGLTRKLPSGRIIWNGEVRFNEQWLNQPLQWKKPSMIFVCAHGDLFHEDVPDEWIDRVFAVMALARHHTFQVLTKRIDRALRYFTQRVNGRVRQIHVWAACREVTLPRGRYAPDTVWPLPNVWCGASIEDQITYDERVTELAAIPAAVRFISAEPLLSDVDMGLLGTLPSTIAPNYTALHQRIHWVIAGGESGRNARPMHPQWVRSIRDQCIEAGLPFFYKQWGEWARTYPVAGGDIGGDIRRGVVQALSLSGECNPGFGRKGDVYMRRVGKKKAGRLLDGREWNEMPIIHQLHKESI